MTAAAFQDTDRYADDITNVLGQHGLLSDEEEMKRYLRGW
jgi:hypothetical protein